MATMLSPLLLLLLLCVGSSAVTSPHPTLSASKPPAYEVLASYNFPVGLLPKGVTGYDLDSETGEFTAYLNGSCSFSLENSYELRYQSTISGVIETNRLYNLQGVAVKILFFWINIIEVDRVDDELQFSVGIASANFPIDSFYESPQCGCGFDCGNATALGRLGEEGAFKIRLRGPF